MKSITTIILLFNSIFYALNGQTQFDAIGSELAKLELILQEASRSSQRVFVEDFTGLQ